MTNLHGVRGPGQQQQHKPDSCHVIATAPSPSPQVLASEDDPTPVLQGPGLKLTAANTCSRWLPAHASASSSSPDSWSLPVSAQSSAALHYNSAGQHSSSVQQDDSTAAVHQMLQDIRSTEQEVSALLGSCMQEMNSMLVSREEAMRMGC